MEDRTFHIDMPPRMPAAMTGQDILSPLPSPRMTYIVGEKAPAMSPLDAFAAQGRLLAKRLDEESRKLGRPVSRLPHTAVVDTLGKRTKPFTPKLLTPTRSPSRGSNTHEEYGGSRPEIENPGLRPQSVHPRLSNITPDERSSFTSTFPLPILTNTVGFTPLDFKLPTTQSDYFGALRSPSPEAIVPQRQSIDAESHSSHDRSQGSSYDSIGRRGELHRDLSVQSSQSSRSQYSFNQHHSLLAPNPPFARRTASIRSVESNDDSPANASNLPLPCQRRVSSSSSRSGARSPISPVLPQLKRTPSQVSELSVDGSRYTHKFSRPISRAEIAPLSPVPLNDSQLRPREESLASPLSTASAWEPATPSSFAFTDLDRSFEYQDSAVADTEASYTHSTFSLPRGRMVGRDSLPLEVMMPSLELATQPRRPKTETRETAPANLWLPRVSSADKEAKQLKTPERVLPSSKPAKLQQMPAIPAIPDLNHRKSMTSMSSGSTIKASSPDKKRSTELTAEDHLAKGIACHEKGSLNESTYHLRIAAKQNLPTAMLLYALACRHGWGMRPNPSEAIQWLRKAMDCASIELAQEEDPAAVPSAGAQARKTRKAQFALSVYELGVSHMNGWGIEQDKALALRCFEIASSWGDADAMAEAGFCYTQGVGCKKDLKKAAKYYRGAEAKGMSMVGNSWYVELILTGIMENIPHQLAIGSTSLNTPMMATTIEQAEATRRTRKVARRSAISREQDPSLDGRSQCIHRWGSLCPPRNRGSSQLISNVYTLEKASFLFWRNGSGA